MGSAASGSAGNHSKSALRLLLLVPDHQFRFPCTSATCPVIARSSPAAVECTGCLPVVSVPALSVIFDGLREATSRRCQRTHGAAEQLGRPGRFSSSAVGPFARGSRLRSLVRNCWRSTGGGKLSPRAETIPHKRTVVATVDLASDTLPMAIRPELRDELLKLPADERQELADKLYESLDDEPVDPAWERAWSDELAGRVQEIADGTVQLVDADEMHAELRDELRPSSE